jgi:hypothetical protein
MDRKPSLPGDLERPPEANHERAAEDAPHEAFGVVELTRRTKDDGRQLLVFARLPGR